MDVDTWLNFRRSDKRAQAAESKRLVALRRYSWLVDSMQMPPAVPRLYWNFAHARASLWSCVFFVCSPEVKPRDVRSVFVCRCLSFGLHHDGRRCFLRLCTGAQCDWYFIIYGSRFIAGHSSCSPPLWSRSDRRFMYLYGERAGSLVHKTNNRRRHWSQTYNKKSEHTSHTHTAGFVRDLLCRRAAWLKPVGISPEE